jgi:hypothetical protein
MNDYLDNDLQTAIDAEASGELTEWEEQQFDEQAKKVQQWQQKKAQQYGRDLQDKLTREGLEEAAKDLGVDPMELANLTGQFPNESQELFKAGVKNFYKGVHQRARDPRTGRFVSNQQPAQPHQMQGPQGQVVQRQAPQPQGAGLQRVFTTASPEQRQTDLRATVKKHHDAGTVGSDDHIEDMFGAVLPKDDPFMQNY